MNDYQIRNALKRKLFNRHSKNPDILIIEELGLKHGAARVDIVVISDILHGFELKSNRDTLLRLPDQARIYNSVLDRITIVVGYRHAYEAMQIVPEWWGVKLVDVGPRGAIHFSEARRPRDNPSPDILAIAKLLWRDEALEFLDEIGAADGLRSKPRAKIYERISEVSDKTMLRSKVCQQLKYRKNWRSAERQRLNGG